MDIIGYGAVYPLTSDSSNMVEAIIESINRLVLCALFYLSSVVLTPITIFRVVQLLLVWLLTSTNMFPLQLLLNLQYVIRELYIEQCVLTINIRM